MEKPALDPPILHSLHFSRLHACGGVWYVLLSLVFPEIRCLGPALGQIQAGLFPGRTGQRRCCVLPSEDAVSGFPSDVSSCLPKSLAGCSLLPRVCLGLPLACCRTMPRACKMFLGLLGWGGGGGRMKCYGLTAHPWLCLWSPRGPDVYKTCCLVNHVCGSCCLASG